VKGIVEHLGPEKPIEDAILQNIMQCYPFGKGESKIGGHRPAVITSFFLTASILCRLPAFKMANEIVETIAAHQITVIAGDTGCGKNCELFRQLHVTFAFFSDTFFRLNHASTSACSRRQNIEGTRRCNKHHCHTAETNQCYWSIGTNCGRKK
jgi:hypothetical protein